jgi:hypothetical protein
VLREGLAIAGQAVFVVNAAIDEIERDAWQSAPCFSAQILDVDGSFDAHVRVSWRVDVEVDRH